LHAWEAKLIQFVAGQLEEKDHLEDLKKWVGERGVYGLDSSGLC